MQSAFRARQTLEGAFRFAQASGFTVNRKDFERMWSEVASEVSQGRVEPTRPLNRFPLLEEMTTRETVTARGYQQKILVFSRGRTSGELRVRPYTITQPETVLTRRGAIAAAVEDYRQYESQYGETVLGGIYAGTTILQPPDLTGAGG